MNESGPRGSEIADIKQDEAQQMHDQREKGFAAEASVEGANAMKALEALLMDPTNGKDWAQRIVNASDTNDMSRLQASLADSGVTVGEETLAAILQTAGATDRLITPAMEALEG